MSDSGQRKWENLVVGERECPYNEVAKLLMETMRTATGGANVLWRDLAYELSLEQTQIDELEKLQTQHILRSILWDWRQNKHSGATLGNLEIHLKELKWNSCAEKIRNYGTEACHRTAVSIANSGKEACHTAAGNLPLYDSTDLNPPSSTNRMQFSNNFYITFAATFIIFVVLLAVMSVLEFRVKKPTDECRLIGPNALQVGSYNEYKKLASSKCIKHLSIVSTDSTRWDSHINVRNAEYIKSVHLEGSLLPSTIASVLSQTTNLVELNFGPCIRVNKKQTEAKHFESIYLPHIEQINFANFTFCSHILSMFKRFPHLNNLQRLGLHGTFLDSNVVNLHTLLQIPMISLQDVEFSGDVYMSKSVFQGDLTFPSVRKVGFNLRAGSSFFGQVPIQLDSSFCKQFKNVETFENYEGMKYEELLNLLEYCHKLKNITATVLIKDGTELWDINHVELQQRLEVAIIYFVFREKCPNKNEVNMLGIDEFKLKVTKYSFVSNCFCSGTKYCRIS